MSKRMRIAVLALLTALVVSLSFLGGAGASWYWFVQRPNSQAAAEAEQGVPKDVQDKFKIFWEAWNLVQQEYYNRPVDQQTMVYGAAKGMVAALNDGYSVFVSPQENQDFKVHLGGGFEGIGAWMEMKDNRLTVVAPIPGSPAAEAGLREGDVIVKVDDKDITSLSMPEAINLIRGPKGSKVKISIVRAGQENLIEMELTRAEIKYDVLSSRMLDNNLGYIRLATFGETTTDELDRALKDILAKNPKGIILDLRGNGGGYVDPARQMLGRFLDGGVAFYQEMGKDGEQKVVDVLTGEVKAYDTPLVVLVNGGSASASEIVAGALQDRGRAKLIGEKTFGKGSVQALHDLSDGSSVRITFAHWLTPQKRQIQGQGLTPDIQVGLTEQDFKDGKDPQLDRAQQYLTEGK